MTIYPVENCTSGYSIMCRGHTIIPAFFQSLSFYTSKEKFNQKLHFCHRVLILMSFQMWMTKKGNVLENVHSALFHNMKAHSIVDGLSNSKKDQAKITYKTYTGVIKSGITHLHVLWL